MIQEMTLEVHVPAGVDASGDEVQAIAADGARRLAEDSGAEIVGELQFIGVSENGGSRWTVLADRPEASVLS